MYSQTNIVKANKLIYNYNYNNIMMKLIVSYKHNF